MESISSLPSPCSDKKTDISYQQKHFVCQQQPPIYQQQPQFFQQQPQCTQMDSEYKNNFNYQKNQTFNQAFYGQTNCNQQAYVNLSQDPLYNSTNNMQQYQPPYNHCYGQPGQSTVLKLLSSYIYFAVFQIYGSLITIVTFYCTFFNDKMIF